MFVLRAKCRLSDASGEVPLWGLAGAPARHGGDAAVWRRRPLGERRAIRLPDAAGLGALARRPAAGPDAPARRR